jgi:hypothetical protein
LRNFGKPTGEFGTVEQPNEDDAVVKWDDEWSYETAPTVAQKGVARNKAGLIRQL